MSTVTGIVTTAKVRPLASVLQRIQRVVTKVQLDSTLFVALDQ